MRKVNAVILLLALACVILPAILVVTVTKVENVIIYESKQTTDIPMPQWTRYSKQGTNT